MEFGHHVVLVGALLLLSGNSQTIEIQLERVTVGIGTVISCGWFFPHYRWTLFAGKVDWFLPVLPFGNQVEAFW